MKKKEDNHSLLILFMFLTIVNSSLFIFFVFPNVLAINELRCQVGLEPGRGFICPLSIEVSELTIGEFLGITKGYHEECVNKTYSGFECGCEDCENIYPEECECINYENEKIKPELSKDYECGQGSSTEACKKWILVKD